MSDYIPKKNLKQGVLIAIEGIDGAGKTTQAKMLVEKLTKEGYPTILLHEPTDGHTGQYIRSLAKGEKIVPVEDEFSLFLQDRNYDVHKNINPALEQKKVIVMDRYYFSSIAYQGARGLDQKVIEEENKKVAPEPNLLLILDVPPNVSLHRIIQNRAEGPNVFEKVTRLEKAREIFNSFINRRYVKIVEGNGQRLPVEIAESIWSIVEPVVAEYVDEMFEVKKLEELLQKLYSQNPIDEDTVKLVETQLTELLCPKGKKECEPTYCTFQITDTCDFLKLKRK